MTLRLVLVGWGVIGAEVARLLSPAVTLVGVAIRDVGLARNGLGDVPLIHDPSALATLAPDLVVEAAGRAAVLPWGRAALEAGADFAPASTSAFAVDAVLAELVGLAKAAGRQVLIPPGALGGMDALAAASLLRLESVVHEVVKPAAAWRGTKAEGLCDLAGLMEAFVFFTGTARQAAAEYPQNANVALISALAGMGPDLTEVRLVADPAAQLNRHRVIAQGDFGRLEITLDNKPFAANPKTSALTALSLVRLIENRIAPLVI